MLFAHSLHDLIKDNHSNTNLLGLTAIVKNVAYKRRNKYLFTFLVKGTQHYSSINGHIVNIKFLNNAKQLLKNDVKIFCSCPAWLYWGSAYNSTQNKYNYRGKRETRPPNKRDPHRERKVCKHLVAISQQLKGLTFSKAHNKFKIISSMQDLDTISFNHPLIQQIVNDKITIQDVSTDLAFENAMLESFKL